MAAGERVIERRATQGIVGAASPPRCRRRKVLPVAAGTPLLQLLWLALLFSFTTPLYAQTRVALVSTCGGEAGQNVLALAEAKLSVEKDIALVERALVEKVLDEQKLARCGLSDSAQALAVGKLLGVEVFATLETFPNSQETLGLVVFDARSGAKLWDATLPGGGPDKTAEGIVTAVHEACEKRLRPTTKLRTICLLSVRNAELPRAMDSFCESVGQLLERGLLGSASLTVLERERLEQINRERALPTNDLANDLLASLTLLELEFSRGSESNGVKATVFLSDASGASLGKVQATGRTEQVTDLVELLLQKLTQFLNAAPALTTVDRPREAQRFWQEATFFIEQMQFAKGLQAAEAAYALNPADKELRALLADALSKTASDILAPGQPWMHFPAPKATPGDLKRALGLAHRSADLSLEIHTEIALAGRPPQRSWMDKPTIQGFLQRARNVKEGYDEESRRQLGELQAKYRRLLVELWERPTFASNGDPDLADCCPGTLYWFLNDLEFGSPTSERWTTDALEVLGHWLALLDERGLCNVNIGMVNWMLTPIVYRIRNPSKMYLGCYGQCWNLSDADAARFQAFLKSVDHRREPLLQLYAMMSEFAMTLRNGNGKGDEVTNQFERIMEFGEQIISRPPCQKSDNYRVAVYQVLLDTIDLLSEQGMRRKEYQKLFDFMLERREYVDWVVLATVKQQPLIYGAYQHMASVFPNTYPEAVSEGDPETCARNLQRILRLLESPDCRRITKVSIQAPRPRSSSPWSSARLLYDGSGPLLERRVCGNLAWALEWTPYGFFDDGVYPVNGLMRSMWTHPRGVPKALHLMSVPLDGAPPQRYDRTPVGWPPEKVYSAIVNDGIVIFPTNAAAVSYLTEANGLPSSNISAAAYCDGKLYAGIGANSGYQGTPGYLIKCDLATGRVTVLASSLRKEKLSGLDGVSPPFFIRQMIADPARHRVLFTVDIGVYKGGTTYTGLWSVDTKDDKLVHVLPLKGYCEWVSPVRNSEFMFTRRKVERMAEYEVFSFDLEKNKARLLSTPAPDTKQFIQGNDPVFHMDWQDKPPHLVVDGWLWVGEPFSRIPITGGPREFLSLQSSGWGGVMYFEPVGNGKQVLVGTGNQLWLLDLKPTTPAAADPSKDKP